VLAAVVVVVVGAAVVVVVVGAGVVLAAVVVVVVGAGVVVAAEVALVGTKYGKNGGAAVVVHAGGLDGYPGYPEVEHTVLASPQLFAV